MWMGYVIVNNFDIILMILKLNICIKMFNTYVINLDRSKQRLESFHKHFEKTDIYKSIIRFQAIDGKNIDEDLLLSKTNFLTRNFVPSSTMVVPCLI